VVKVLAVNMSLAKSLFKFSLIVIGILLLVYLIAVLTPWLAKQIDKRRPNPERVDEGLSDTDNEIKNENNTQGKEIENGVEADNGKGQ
jgi:hypothetical protein